MPDILDRSERPVRDVISDAELLDAGYGSAGWGLSTHHVRSAGTVRVRCWVGVTAGAVVTIGGAGELGRFSRLPLVDYQVNGHLTLQATNVPVAEVIAQFVNLHTEKMFNLFNYIRSSGEK
jgi:hypothetical protein